jgi:hypothetical protein
MIDFVICGLEHSGTTLVSDLFRQVPDIEAGFEVGVLMCDSPRTFIDLKPYNKNIITGWEISQDDLVDCCQTDDFSEFYRNLCSKSPLIGPKTKRSFDKTPRYLSILDRACSKIAVPFIVVYKDPRSTVYSDFARSNAETFEIWYESYKRSKIRYMRNLYNQFVSAKENPTVWSVRLEDLCLNTLATCRELFDFVNTSFTLDYLLLKNLRYHHTRDATISPRIALEYRTGLTKAQQMTIESDFKEFGDWFFDFK